MSSSITVRFEPDGYVAEVSAGQTIAEAAHSAEIDLYLPCGGKGTCGKCRVTVLEGEFSAPSEAELRTLGEDELLAGIRLACQAVPLGAVAVAVPPEARVIGTKALNGDLVRPVALHPNVQQIPVVVPPPSLEDQRSDFDRVKSVLQVRVNEVTACPPCLQCLPAILRQEDFRIVCTTVGSRLVDVHPGTSLPPTLGVAVDIGTTTVVAYVADLLTGKELAASASLNDQGRHGADVISRIDYANSHEGGLEELRQLVLGTINSTIAEALAKFGGDAGDIYEVTVVGNTAMNHLFMGLDPRYVAQAPYVPVSALPQELRQSDAGIVMHPRGNVFCLPVIAGFVGADTVAVILATDMLKRDKPTLAVDIGTNGELALWTGDRLLVASCAAGPAFEGAQIEHGMRAAAGAIEHIAVVDGEVSVRTIGDLPPVGICGSGLFDAMAALLELGVVDPSGRFSDKDPETFPVAVGRRILGVGNERRFVFSDPDADGQVYLSQRDVRELQLAKGAVRAAIELLLQHAGLQSDDLDEIVLAGAFGNYINPRSAVRIGMLPDLPLGLIKGVGNAAGAGALLALICLDEREDANQIAASAEHLELSRSPQFQMAFMETMLFP